MQLKKIKQKDLDALASTIDNEGFWYAISVGGYIDPEDILKNKEDIKKVRNAINILLEFEASIPLL